MLLTDRQTRILATIGTLTAVSMYVSYIPQIQMNLAGHKGSALCAAINCTLWVIYALFKPQRDIPVALANAPGIPLGIIACLTAL